MSQADTNIKDADTKATIQNWRENTTDPSEWTDTVHPNQGTTQRPPTEAAGASVHQTQYKSHSRPEYRAASTSAPRQDKSRSHSRTTIMGVPRGLFCCALVCGSCVSAVTKAGMVAVGCCCVGPCCWLDHFCGCGICEDCNPLG
ncbi:uncharacterized protein L199_001012 [Kwoniella botswanensis]|uniref:uncharacterized protein n=1 Tax=Kwoniella botswanensis TaxID=1268659 RepID=UPI00315CFACE